jgi:hypothetical protein
MNHPKPDWLHLTLADLISDQIEQRHAAIQSATAREAGGSTISR